MSDIRTDNDFLFGSNGASIQPMIPVLIKTRQQAYRTAAWLASMAAVLPSEELPSSFEDVLDAIRNT